MLIPEIRLKSDWLSALNFETFEFEHNKGLFEVFLSKIILIKKFEIYKKR